MATATRAGLHTSIKRQTEVTTAVPANRPNPLPLRWSRAAILLPLVTMALAIIEIQFHAASWELVYQQILRSKLIDRILDGAAHFATLNQFPEAITVAIVCIAIWIHAPRYRHAIAPLIAALALTSAAIGVVKEVTGRARPPYGIRLVVEGNQQEIIDFLAKNPNPVLKPEPGDYWLWFSPHRPWFSGDYASFPSGHASSAFVFALWLAILYPKGKWLWYAAAVGTCLARVRFRRHHPGDVMFGAALGWLIAYALFTQPWMMRFGYWVQGQVERLTGPGTQSDD